MKNFHEFSKTVLSTVFFCFIYLFVISCKSNDQSFIHDNKSLNSKYDVKYKIETKSFTEVYYKGADTLFFPILKLKADGLLESNYIQKLDENSEYWLLNSSHNMPIKLGSTAENFSKFFGFSKTPIISKIPRNFENNKTYFIKFYFHANNEEKDFNFLYLKMIIELFDSKSETDVTEIVWIGEGNFVYDKDIKLGNMAENCINFLIKYSFITKQANGTLYLLNN